jgi:hypothetical protein
VLTLLASTVFLANLEIVVSVYQSVNNVSITSVGFRYSLRQPHNSITNVLLS